jgi:hypothetical protein
LACLCGKSELVGGSIWSTHREGIKDALSLASPAHILSDHRHPPHPLRLLFTSSATAKPLSIHTMLDLLIAPAAFAEDQPYSRLILGIHVIHRGFNLGSFIGVTSSLALGAFSKARSRPFSFSTTTIRYAARGGLLGLGFGALALTGRMYSRDLIEWQDRSWRLLQHPTQNQTDHWSVAGAGAGALWGAVAQRATVAGPRALMGGAAIGSSSAIVAMMAYRAMRGGKV